MSRIKVTPPRKVAIRIPFVLEMCFVASENTRTNIVIYEVGSRYICTNLYIHDYDQENNEQRAQTNARANSIKG